MHTYNSVYCYIQCILGVCVYCVNLYICRQYKMHENEKKWLWENSLLLCDSEHVFVCLLCIGRLTHAHKSAIKVIRRMQYFVARRKFQVRAGSYIRGSGGVAVGGGGFISTHKHTQTLQHSRNQGWGSLRPTELSRHVRSVQSRRQTRWAKGEVVNSRH